MVDDSDASVSAFVVGAFLLIAVQQVTSECSDVSFSSRTAKLDAVKRVTRFAVSGHISAYTVHAAITDDDFQLVRQANGNPMVLYSTLSNTPTWTHVDFLASVIRITAAFDVAADDIRSPLLILTVCDYDTPITSFDDSSFSVETHHAGLVSMYENDLCVVFRSYRSGIFFFSMADQGDVLIAQIIHGTVHVIFDFGSLSPSRISAGKALDDGKWHEMRWLHQFDSVQLSIDGVLLNQTAPTGLYRKLDLHSTIHIAGRPADDFSQGIETSFTGCIARLQLNNADLLQFAPHGIHQQCNMPRPPSFTLHNASRALLPFTFLPFSFEFRLLPVRSQLLTLLDAENGTLVDVLVDDDLTLLLVSNVTKFKQAANPGMTVADGAWHSFSLRIRGARLEIDVDGQTTLWLEGQEVRRVSVRLSNFVLSAVGCYRSATIDFSSIRIDGTATHDACNLTEKCIPNPCENSGKCLQTSLDDYTCNCTEGYGGKNCHTTDVPHSCEEWAFTKGNRVKASKGRNVTIDVDGGGPMTPIRVTCRLERDSVGLDGVSTIVEHDLSTPMIVTGDNKPGAVRHTLDYGITTDQMDRLVEGFESCTQYMRYTCRGGVRLMTQGDERSPSSWYATRSDKHGLQWGDAPPYSRMCSCAVNGSCLHNRMCNCDSGDDATDEGVNPYAQLLPVTGLFLGGTTKSSSIEVEIGPLRCRNRVAFEAVTFADRNARLTGVQTFSARTFDVGLHVKFAHAQMSVVSWHSVDDIHWFHVYVHEGRIVAEIINGGESVQLVSDHRYDDGHWHSIYWEADAAGMMLRVDGARKHLRKPVILPNVYNWIIGSRTEKGSTGFAGVVRNVYLCGQELALSQIVRRGTEEQRGVALGDEGYCRPDLCQNGGRCVDKYDGYVCDCTMTPFGGADCSDEYGMLVPLGSTVQIPWQNPAHAANCHRIAVQTTSANVSLMKSRAHFADSTFNLTIDGDGFLHVDVYDGYFFRYQKKSPRHNLSDDVTHDVAFCATNTQFNLTVDGERAIEIEGNWTFFSHFNVWQFFDLNFEGCVSRMQTGTAFPLKNPKAARLNYSNKIKFGTCPNDVNIAKQFEWTTTTSTTADPSDIHIFAISQHKQRIVSITTIGGLVVMAVLALILLLLVCYMRSRPEGVYKTHETGENCSPSRSEEPLVHNNNNNNNNSSNQNGQANSQRHFPGGKEYFC